ncbi:hypothetical protein O6H91_12G097100 [Diphasiastrum complanatum]|uniref:Uncharacterized protein n=1 Tax=Diphasiastrum complanatum TaxID=34168 RepID=A0ACC2C531_DIPCM|nr:hypothetical protein O6H91_12G097100 [Diphasiastrum complanatum]
MEVGSESVMRGTVCVTGATGYFASWLVKCLLERGYCVRGTVRDLKNPAKTAHLLKLFGAKERLQLVEADILDERSLDAALSGCEGVFHTASPVIFYVDDPQAQLMEPAVTGTLNVLKACTNHPTINRVVMTSSTATVQYPDDELSDQVLDESNWSSVELCTRLKLWYALSKMLAEQAAWKFSEDKKYVFISILPSAILGPILPPTITSSAKMILDILKGDTLIASALIRMGYVHIDDVASAHILAYEKQEANGRYMCSSIDMSYHELEELLQHRYPNYKVPISIPKDIKPSYTGLSSTKIQKLGLQFKGIEESFDDTINSLIEKGVL